MNPIKPWLEVVSLHPDVVSEGFSEDIFALDLGPLADGNKNVPAVYRDPEQFFRASYLTKGLHSLLSDVLSRLSGGTGNRVLKLVTPFGGGKSHTLAALFHAARNRKALDVIPEGRTLPQVGLPAAPGAAQAGGAPPKRGIRTAEIVEGFYSFLGFTRLLTDAVVRKSVARGVQEGAFGYAAGGVPELGADGKYQVALSKIRFCTSVAEDEVDLETGFIILPKALPAAVAAQAGIPQPASATYPVSGTTSPEPQPTTIPPAAPTTGGTSIPTPPTAPAVQREVTLTFSADRNQLFTAWNAIANLADMAGKVEVSIRAESEKGFDKGKLQNGVLEPLREANLIE